MTTSRIFNVPAYVFYGVAALVLLFTLGMVVLGFVSSARLVGPLILGFFMIVPALMLALLTWQVSTGERVNLFELIVAALITVGQTLAGFITLLVGLYDAGNDWGFSLYGLLGIVAGVALGAATTSGFRARNRVLRGVTT